MLEKHISSTVPSFQVMYRGSGMYSSVRSHHHSKRTMSPRWMRMSSTGS